MDEIIKAIEDIAKMIGFIGMLKILVLLYGFYLIYNEIYKLREKVRDIEDILREKL